jgi:RNA polymerase sigma-70 factor (ECF subfamily)
VDVPEMVQAPPVGPVDEIDEPEQLRRSLIDDLDGGFAEVMRAHERVVYSVALRLSATAADAEDVAAETFLRAYRALRDYDAARIRTLRIRPWLLTILRNTARNTARDAARRPDPPPAFVAAEPPVAGPSVEQQVVQELARAEWGRLLGRLPEAQRTAVVLRHVEGVPTSEIAQVLGCAQGTAKSHVSRGLSKLRTLLAEGASPSTPTGPARPTDSGGEVR